MAIVTAYIDSSFPFEFVLGNEYEIKRETNSPSITFNPYSAYQFAQSHKHSKIYKIAADSEDIPINKLCLFPTAKKFTVIDIIRIEDFVNEIKEREEKQWWKDGVFLGLCYRKHLMDMNKREISSSNTYYCKDGLIIPLSSGSILTNYSGDDRKLIYDKNDRFEYMEFYRCFRFTMVHDKKLMTYNVITPFNKLLSPDVWFSNIEECFREDMFRVHDTDGYINYLSFETGKLLTKHKLSSIDMTMYGRSRYISVLTPKGKKGKERIFLLDKKTDELVAFPVKNMSFHLIRELGFDIFLLMKIDKYIIINANGDVLIDDVYKTSVCTPNGNIFFYRLDEEYPLQYSIITQEITSVIDFNEFQEYKPYHP